MKNTADKKNYRRLLAVIQKSNGRTFEDIAKEHVVSVSEQSRDGYQHIFRWEQKD